MPYTTFYLDESDKLRRDLDAAGVREARESGVGTLWVDVGDTTDEDGEFLLSVFNFHPLGA